MPATSVRGQGGDLAHALRNPLSSVKIALQSVGRDAPPPYANRARLALREVRKMERLLSALAECGTAPHMNPQVCDLGELVACCAEEVAEELALRKASVGASVRGQLAPVHCDAGRIRPLLSQLLLEAADCARGENRGAVEVVLSATGRGVDLLLPLSAGTRGTTVTTCADALTALLGPAGGTVHWTKDDGGGLKVCFPLAG
jgi:two-component system sensor histidine kinase HydH